MYMVGTREIPLEYVPHPPSALAALAAVANAIAKQLPVSKIDGYTCGLLKCGDGRILAVPTDKIDEWNQHVLGKWRAFAWLTDKDRFVFIHSQGSWKTWSVTMSDSGMDMILLGSVSPLFAKMESDSDAAGDAAGDVCVIIQKNITRLPMPAAGQ